MVVYLRRKVEWFLVNGVSVYYLVWGIGIRKELGGERVVKGNFGGDGFELNVRGWEDLGGEEVGVLLGV